VLFVSELELLFSDESEELELVLELGEVFTDSLDSVVLFLLHDLVVSEFVAGADELDIELLLSAGADAADPELLAEGLDVLWAKAGTASAIAAARVEALTIKPSRDFIWENLLASQAEQVPYRCALSGICHHDVSNVSVAFPRTRIASFRFRVSTDVMG
jgi:hypothetical protein